MPTAPPAIKPLEKFAAEKAIIGGVTLLTLQGTLHDGFEGRKLAESIRTRKLVVSLRDVRRFASWGMSEWMDFLRVNAERDLYLVECSAYSVGQINLVTGLLGHAKLVSFYAAYRCGSCSEEFETLLLIPRDRAAIRDLPGSQQECATCGGKARMEEYPAAFFDRILARPSFEIDDEVLALLRSRFEYDLTPDLSRFRAYRRVHKGYTYLRLSGSLALLPPDVLTAASQGTTVLDLAGVVFDPDEVGAWRTYLQAALSKLPSLQLLNGPPGFLDRAVGLEDLSSSKLKVRTFMLEYDCARCDATVVHLMDVAENLEQLARGETPFVACPTCQSLLAAGLSPEQTVRLRALPARARDLALDRFLAKVRTVPSEKLENCLHTVARNPAQPAGPGISRTVYVALALCLLLVVSLTAMVLKLWSANDDMAPAVVAAPAVAQPPRPTFTRPDWILFDVPASAYCHEMINRLMCIGVSSYRLTRDDAVTEANDTALEELVSTVGLKISDPYFREHVLPGYSAARAKALTALQAADLDRSSKAYADAVATLRKARKRVVEVLQASGGAAVPSQRSDWYWEEYAGENGKPNEVLVFVRYDVTLDSMRGLIEKYSTTSSVTGTSAMTAFPGMAWQHAEFTGGAILTKVGRLLAGAGVAPHQVVTAIGEQRVIDATSFARQLEGASPSGGFTLTVKAGDTPAQVVNVPRP